MGAGSTLKYLSDCAPDSPGINQTLCEAKGCCWMVTDPNPDNVPWCYEMLSLEDDAEGSTPSNLIFSQLSAGHIWMLSVLAVVLGGCAVTFIVWLIWKRCNHRDNYSRVAVV